MMERIAVIGGGVSGLSIAQCLKDRFNVRVYEAESRAGGLIKCKRVDENLYHVVGGHVFNSKRKDVLDWFWNFFDREKEFVKANRNACVFLTKPIGYPIENHIYELTDDLQKKIVDDLLQTVKNGYQKPSNFEDFLKCRFGNTLYELYFKPYNEKIWKRKLSDVSLDWLEGKLPMPTVEEIILNNFRKAEETQMVHSSFYYSKINGSQFIADRLAQNLDVVYNQKIETISREKTGWTIDGAYFDKIVYTGNIKKIPAVFASIPLSENLNRGIENLEYHGTTSVLCKIEKNPYSWIYMPDNRHQSHRMICTGNFASSNNAKGMTSAIVEFTDYVDLDTILKNLEKIPNFPKYITHQYTQFTYPVQTSETRSMIEDVKKHLEKQEVYLLGRFAEWEYYNMDAAMGAALDLCKRI